MINIAWNTKITLLFTDAILTLLVGTACVHDSIATHGNNLTSLINTMPHVWFHKFQSQAILNTSSVFLSKTTLIFSLGHATAYKWGVFSEG